MFLFRLGYAVYICEKCYHITQIQSKLSMILLVLCLLKGCLYIIHILNVSVEYKVESDIFLHDNSSLSRLQLAVPIFHGYGHKTECQVSCHI